MAARPISFLQRRSCTLNPEIQGYTRTGPQARRAKARRNNFDRVISGTRSSQGGDSCGSRDSALFASNEPMTDSRWSAFLPKRLAAFQWRGVSSLPALLADNAALDFRIVGRTLLHAAAVGVAAGVAGAALFAGLELFQRVLLKVSRVTRRFERMEKSSPVASRRTSFDLGSCCYFQHWEASLAGFSPASLLRSRGEAATP